MEPPAAEAATDKGSSAAVDSSAAVGAAAALTPSDSPQVGETSTATPAKAAPLANLGDRVASGPGALWWVAVIVGGLVLIYAGARLFDPVEPLRRHQPGRLLRRFM